MGREGGALGAWRRGGRAGEGRCWDGLVEDSKKPEAKSCCWQPDPLTHWELL